MITVKMVRDKGFEFVVGDLINHQKLNSTGTKMIKAKFYDDYYVTEFAPRPNTGSMPCDGELLVDVILCSGKERAASASEFSWSTGFSSSIKSWKPSMRNWTNEMNDKQETQIETDKKPQDFSDVFCDIFADIFAKPKVETDNQESKQTFYNDLGNSKTLVSSYEVVGNREVLEVFVTDNIAPITPLDDSFTRQIETDTTNAQFESMGKGILSEHKHGDQYAVENTTPAWNDDEMIGKACGWALGKVEWKNGDECIYMNVSGVHKVIGRDTDIESALWCKSSCGQLNLLEIDKLTKPETPQAREERERLEAAMSLLDDNRDSKLCFWSEASEELKEHILWIVDKTGYRK